MGGAIGISIPLLMGILFCILGPFLFNGIGSWSAFIQFLFDEPSHQIIILFTWSLALVLIFIIISIFSNKKTIVISEKEVQCFRKRFPRSEKSWIEPIIRYKWIYKSLLYTSNKHNQTVWFCVKLIHENNAKDVEVFAFLTEEEQRQALEQLSSKLLKPIYETVNSKLTVVHQHGDLEKSLIEKEISRNEKFKSLIAYSGKSIKITESSSEFTARFQARGGRIIGFFLFSLAIALIFNGLESSLGIIAPGLILMVMGILVSLPSIEELKIMQDGTIKNNLYVFGKSMRNLEIPFSEIEEIHVDSDPTYGNVKRFTRAVRIISDKRIINFAHWAKESDKQWVAEKTKQLVVEWGRNQKNN